MFGSKKSTKYIFVAGGVMSGIGKGVTTSSIAKIMQSRGLKVTAMKIDPYVNVDAGTMTPTEHGEVFVLSDGLECDQDMGNYERFLNTDLTRDNYMTTGSVYLSVIGKERNLEYGGKNVEVVPHIPNEVIDQIDRAVAKVDAEVVVVEVGGTVGEYQNILFLEAYRMLKFRHPDDCAFVLVSYLPVLNGELKSKPTQYAVRSVNSTGIQPDFIVARCDLPIDAKRKEKIAFNCSLPADAIIGAPTVSSIYEVPVNFENEGFAELLAKKLGLSGRDKDMKEWREMVDRIKASTETVKIGIAGKYFATGSYVLADSYISVIEAVKHAASAQGKKAVIEWLNVEEFEKDPAQLSRLSEFGGIIVPGGFGDRGVEGKISVIKYCRENKIPYLGICYGMQLAVVEYARHVAGMTDANTTEVNPTTTNPVIDILPEQKELLAKKQYGASMRLGNYPALLKKGTIAYEQYGEDEVVERHRHRYEVNPEYIERIEKAGMVFSGTSPSRKLMEFAELPKSAHPYFVGTQAHPELLSRPLRPHPLFVGLIKASIERKQG
jgi:CTP synthase